VSELEDWKRRYNILLQQNKIAIETGNILLKENEKLREAYGVLKRVCEKTRIDIDKGFVSPTAIRLEADLRHAIKKAESILKESEA
jgi:hypothetical protein